MSGVDEVSSAFKHINLYEILEPERVHNVQTAKLIDINDDKLDSNPDLIGSFVDNVTKKEFDILDVFENIYVTPQHLQRQNKNDLDFNMFIKESKGELDVASHVESTNRQTDRQQVESNKVRSLDEIFDNIVSTRSFPKLNRLNEAGIDNPKQVNEDLIDEFLQSKPTIKLETIKTPIPSTSVQEDVQKTEGTVKNHVFETFKLQNTSQNVQPAVAGKSMVINDLPVLAVAKKINNKNLTPPKPRLEENRLLLKIYQNEIKTALIDENKIIAYKQNPPIPMLQTVKVDKKAFAKRIVKGDSEKASFTKGPDLYEKSLVLPQIMHRLRLRKEIIDAKTNVRRKLILDCQSNANSASFNRMPALAPETLLEDCNKKRLEAIKKRKAFDEFIKGKI
ncbi:unnamed protein product, partial [Brenthis ino]